ncbi:MAG: hypothetical protein HY875_14010 [Chloroflexi bacterium]|nr:hypothetical protein [Chloroflexota bacterium]
MVNLCGCCGGADRAAVVLRFRGLAWRAGWFFDGQAPAERPLCVACANWLLGVVNRTAGAGRAPALFGAPSRGTRGVAAVDRCNLCGSVTGATAAYAASEPAGHPEVPSIGPLVACGPCEMWLLGIAADGRSAQGAASRAVDGDYGQWPHPNLRHLTVAVETAAPGMARTIEEVCREMGVGIVGPREASVRFGDTPVVAGDAEAGCGTVLLCPFVGRRALIPMLGPGVAEWLTVPSTPQQVSAALVKASREWRDPPQWDAASGLRLVSQLPDPALCLAFEPAPGVGIDEVAWFLKRFSRGYDDVVAIPGTGQVAVVPRARGAGLSRAGTRIAGALSGRAVLAAPGWGNSPARRFEAAG